MVKATPLKHPIEEFDKKEALLLPRV